MSSEGQDGTETFRIHVLRNQCMIETINRSKKSMSNFVTAEKKINQLRKTLPRGNDQRSRLRVEHCRRSRTAVNDIHGFRGKQLRQRVDRVDVDNGVVII